MIHLRWLAPILDCSGYASAARGYLISCEKSGIINVQARDRSRSANLYGKGIDRPILDLYERLSKNVVPKDCPAVQHTVPDVFVKDKNSKRAIGYTIFEMVNIPSIWVPYCNDMTEIWTGSEYSQQSFINSGVKVPVHVLPHAIDVDLFEKAEPWQIKNKRAFAFISIFDFTSRKAWQDLLRAYWTAFDADDDVCLILKVFFGDFSNFARADIIRRICQYRESLDITNAAPILLYGHEIDGNAMPGLYKAADCYVGISREGFGLSYAEAMAAGIACIGPEVGGTRQFMNSENSFLVKYIGDEPISEEMARMNPIFKDLTWAKHDWQDLSKIMRMVVSDKSRRLDIAKKGTDYIKQNLTYEVIGQRINALLEVRPSDI